MKILSEIFFCYNVKKFGGENMNLDEKIFEVGEIIRNAKNILIGAGAGLSTSAGYTYSGERFKKYFADFEKKYGFHDMYSGGFYPYETAGEFWAFLSKNIFCNRYDQPPSEVHKKLLELVRDKNYFILTTNVDHLFFFRQTALTKINYSIRKGITACFSVPRPATKKLMTMKNLFGKCLKFKKISAYPKNFCRVARSAARL